MKKLSKETTLAILKDRNPRHPDWYGARANVYEFIEKNLQCKRLIDGRGKFRFILNGFKVPLSFEFNAALSVYEHEFLPNK